MISKQTKDDHKNECSRLIIKPAKDFFVFNEIKRRRGYFQKHYLFTSHNKLHIRQV